MPSSNHAQPPASVLYIKAFEAELLARYSHLNHFVEQCSREARDRSPHLFSAYRSKLSEELVRLETWAPNVFSVPDETDPGPRISGFFEFLRDQSDRFQENHRALRSFGTPWPESEVFEFLRQLFDENGLGAEFETLHPTIVYVNEFNFLKYDLREELSLPKATSTFAVWALPLAEASNPMLWPVLVHEVAHSLFDPEIIQKRIHAELKDRCQPEILALLKRWSIELNADYFAYRMLGPAYIYCLMYFGMFFLPGRLRDPLSADTQFASRSHPPPEDRLRYLRKEFETFLSAHQLDKNLKLKAQYDRFSAMYDWRVGQDSRESVGGDGDPLARRPKSQLSGDLIEDLNRVRSIVKEVQHELLPQMRDVCFCPQELDFAHGLSVRLTDKDLVIGSIRENADLKELNQYLTSPLEKSTEKRRLDEVEVSKTKKEHLAVLNERPARMFEILNAGWNAKIAALAGWKLNPGPPDNLSEGASNLVDRIMRKSREMTRLLQKSTQISIILSSVSQTDSHTCHV
jgi:hypothetical protein